MELGQKHDHLSSPTECAGLIGPRPLRVLFSALGMRLHLFICIFALLFHGWIGVELNWQVALCKACTFSKGIHLACLTAKCSLKCAREKKFSSAHREISSAVCSIP